MPYAAMGPERWERAVHRMLLPPYSPPYSPCCSS